MQKQNDGDWVPPPPPQEESMFSSGTREFYAKEIRNDATKALIFGFLSIVCCPPIFAYLGYSKAQEVILNIEIYEVEEGKRGMAQAAKVLSIVGIAFWVIGLTIRIISAVI